MKKHNSNKNSINKNTILIVLALSIIISIPFIIQVFDISQAYVNADVRNALYQSTIYLQDSHGILLSTLHVKDVAVSGNIVTIDYEFIYPSTIKKCEPEYIEVRYDMQSSKVIDYTIPYYQDIENVC